MRDTFAKTTKRKVFSALLLGLCVWVGSGCIFGARTIQRSYPEAFTKQMELLGELAADYRIDTSAQVYGVSPEVQEFFPDEKDLSRVLAESERQGFSISNDPNPSRLIIMKRYEIPMFNLFVGGVQEGFEASQVSQLYGWSPIGWARLFSAKENERNIIKDWMVAMIRRYGKDAGNS